MKKPIRNNEVRPEGLAEASGNKPIEDLLGKSEANLRDITARKQAEQALEKSEARYREILELAVDGILLGTPEGIISGANVQMQKLAGRSLEQLLGLHVSVLFDPAELNAKPLRFDLLDGSQALVVERNLLRPDGITLPVEMHSKRMPDGTFQSIYRDVTERKQAELKLREWNASLEQRVAERTLELQDGEARFRQLADATFEGIAISEAGILLDGNLRLAEIHGYELAEMLGRPVADFIAPESQALVAGQIRDGSDTVYECLGLRKDGSVFPAEIHARMGLWMGKATRITALRDLTATKRAAAKLQGLQTELEHVQRLALVSEINAGIVHQISQPLSAIGANLSVLIKLKARDLQRCDALAAVKDVEADVIRMREIVRHLRKLVGQGPRTCALTKLNTIVMEVLPLLRQKADSRMCRIAAELGNDDATVHVDSVQLTQLILNLVSNALDASENCPPERREIRITTRPHGDKAVELSVRDAGTGIAPEALNRLFTPFFSTKPDGLGVGLRLSQTIVQAHGGSIEGYNNPDRVGATFRVVLPVH